MELTVRLVEIGHIFAPCVAAVATCATVWFAFRTCKAAWAQCEAAWAQVELQRPRPVVTVEGDWSLENALDVEPRGFLLQNVGSSPAFDVEVSDIEGPFLQQVQHRERLTTDHIFVLAERKEPLQATHHRHMPGNVIDRGAAFKFVQNASQAFSLRDESGNPSLERNLKFFVAYSALDGRRFRTECLICFNLGIDKLRAQIAPGSSWLGKEIVSGAGLRAGHY